MSQVRDRKRRRTWCCVTTKCGNLPVSKGVTLKIEYTALANARARISVQNLDYRALRLDDIGGEHKFAFDLDKIKMRSAIGCDDVGAVFAPGKSGILLKRFVKDKFEFL